jgi:glycosyltransferase involved in cell wall biosynthesis
VDKRIKIAFVGDVSSSFTKRDYEILKEYFDVYIFQLPRKKINWIKYIFILGKETKQYDLTFSWFAGWHSALAVFFSKLFKKKSVVVVGGFDAAYVPEINYGAFTNVKEKIPALYVYKHADKVLVVNPALKDEIIRNAKVIGDTIDYLPTGFNPEYWKPKGKKENIILTVAGANTLQRVKLKGLEAFIQSAAHMPLAKFIAINVRDDAKKYLEKIATKNVEFTGVLPQGEILDYYQRAKVCCQLSLRE